MSRISIKCCSIVSFTMLCVLILAMVSSYNHREIINVYDASEETDDFYPIIDRLVYDILEDFTVVFNLNLKYDIESVKYETDGFCVVDKPIISDQKLILCLKHDGIVSSPTIKISIELSNGKIVSSGLYGIVENNKLYINQNSFDAAQDIYFSELLNNDIINNREYEKLIMNSNKKCININIKNNNELELPRSVTGGWVTGFLRWRDDWGNWHPLQFTKVSIFDEDPLIDDYLGTVYTDVDGEFLFSFDDNIDDILDSSGRDIFIKVWPQGINSVVKNGNNNEYLIRTNTYFNVSTGSTTIIDIDITMDSDLGRAFQVSQAIITCANYASAMRGTNMESINVRYPHNENSNRCFYRDNNETIYIVGNRNNDNYNINGHILHSYASWDVIMHEYGHFVQDKLNIEDNPGGKHWSSVNMYDHYMSHHNGGSITPNCEGDCANPSALNAKTEAIKIAYAESWPSIFGGMAQQYYVNLGILDNNIQTVGDSEYDSYKDINYDYNECIKGGEAVEQSIMGVLWDVYDCDVEAYDGISLGHNAWWNLTVDGSSITFSDVVSRFYSLYSSYTMWDSFDCLLEYYKMSPDNIEFSSELVSHALPTFSWTPNGTSNNLENNSFRVMIYDSSYSILLDFLTTNTSFSFTQSQWDLIMSSTGSSFYIRIGGSQTDNTPTGYYYSALKEFDKPLIKTALINNKIEIIDYYSWTPSTLTIKSSYNGVSTMTIGGSAFYGCTSLESITIPSTVTSIGSSAFKNCSSLENVTLLREQSPITSLGQNAFDNCASNLTITVPANRVCEYKNTEYWSSYSSKIVPSSSISDHIDLDCMVNDDVISYLNAGYNQLYRLDVECSGSYTISCTGGTQFNIYNSNMVKQASAYYVVEITLSEGTYYIDTEWINVNNSGNATLHFFNKGLNVSSNTTTNILSHLHQVGLNDYRVRLKYNHENGPGFYNIIVNALSNNTINYYTGTITFYTDYNRQVVMNKLNNFYTLQAQSSDGASSMVMYFGSNGHYYFDVILRTDDLTSLTISINSLNTTNLDLFNLSENSCEEVELLNNDIKGDYFEKVVLKQNGRFELTAEFNDNTIGDAYVLIARLIPLNNSYSLDVKLINIIDDNYTSASKTCDLEPDTYYIGYFNNIEGKEISIKFERKITQYGSYNLISDPDINEEYGSEVRFNNGLFLGTTLTVGFTRFIYLNYDYNLPSYSRLDYYFYSSNETIASISEYGTLLGKSAGSIKIMAVYKLDPSITFVKEFTILTDNRLTDLIINNTDNCYYAESGQSYQVYLTDTNSFYPQNTLYNWNIVSSYNNYNYNISEWGTLSLSGSDIIVIEGVSKLNSKLKIRLTLTVYG